MTPGSCRARGVEAVWLYHILPSRECPWPVSDPGELELGPAMLLGDQTLLGLSGPGRAGGAGLWSLMEDQVCVGTSWGPFSMGGWAQMRLCPDVPRGYPGAEGEEASACSHPGLLAHWPQAQNVELPTPGLSSTPALSLSFPWRTGGSASGRPLPCLPLPDTFMALLATTTLVSACKHLSWSRVCFLGMNLWLQCLFVPKLAGWASRLQESGRGRKLVPRFLEGRPGDP